VAISKIFDLLGKNGVTVSDSNIYPDDNLLIFYLASPATLKVNGISPMADDLQFVVIPNPPVGNYEVELVGTDNGQYHLYLGQITPSGNFWHTYTGSTKPSQKENFNFEINFATPLSDPLTGQKGSIHLAQAKQLLEELYHQTNNKILLVSLIQLDKAGKAFGQEKWMSGINSLKDSLRSLSLYRAMLKDGQITQYNQTGEIMEIIAAVWENILRTQEKSSETNARREYRTASQKLTAALKFLENLDRINKKVAKINALSVQSAQNLINSTKIELDKNNFSYAESFAFLANLFAQEGIILR